MAGAKDPEQTSQTNTRQDASALPTPTWRAREPRWREPRFQGPCPVSGQSKYPRPLLLPRPWTQHTNRATRAINPVLVDVERRLKDSTVARRRTGHQPRQSEGGPALLPSEPCLASANMSPRPAPRARRGVLDEPAAPLTFSTTRLRPAAPDDLVPAKPGPTHRPPSKQASRTPSAPSSGTQGENPRPPRGHAARSSRERRRLRIVEASRPRPTKADPLHSAFND